jgi:2,3-bisphosphoglycerate-independent phosphoglycerate mutase
MDYKNKPVVLIILDGWGVAPDTEGNAITRANTPYFLNYIKNYPVMTLSASGSAVGLPFGEMGNSEVGHLNIGAGRVYYQSLPLINHDISTGIFFKNNVFQKAVEHVKKNNSKLHLMGLASSGNVHASIDHLLALLQLAKDAGLSKEVVVQAILDGRDTPYNSAPTFIDRLQKEMKRLKVGRIGSLMGRYYAMDRDNRWDRIEKAYRALTDGICEEPGDDPLAVIKKSYEKEIYDEEFVPTVIKKARTPNSTIEENDAVIFFNFRPDRARQLTEAFVIPGFNKFKRTYLKNLFFVTMTEYEKNLPVEVVYPSVMVQNCLADVISQHGMKQLHIAETEKYAHVTYFLNGMREDPFPGEDRLLVPSPAVAHYDETPAMSSLAIVKQVQKALTSNQYNFIAVNLANPDMVGHTGDLRATIKACEATDKAIGSMVESTLSNQGVVVITADHGNAEEVINLHTGSVDKEHSNNPVPLLIIGKEFLGQAGPGGDPIDGDLSLLTPVGVLGDVAPTVLKILGIEPPLEMIGRALV